MPKKSIIDRIGLFGRAGIDMVSVLGRSTLFLFHALLGRGGIGGGFGLLVKQLHSVGVMSLVFSVVGIWGGSWVAVDWLGVYDGSYWANMQNSVTFSGDVINGIIKSIVFAFVVTWIAVFQGYDCEPTSEGISRATTKTVVYASLAVLGLDFILTALMFGDF